MTSYHPNRVLAFHSCDREVGYRVLNGKDKLILSENSWDWLGEGVYFWEENPGRALEYAKESAQRKQFNLVPINVPFVLGAVIDLGNCLNLVESSSLQILSAAYEGLKKTIFASKGQLMRNRGNNRELDCAVIRYIHQSNLEEGKSKYDTVRCAFPEGGAAYDGASITSRLHLQIAVRNLDCIKGLFLPFPIGQYNPFI